MSLQDKGGVILILRKYMYASLFGEERYPVLILKGLDWVQLGWTGCKRGGGGVVGAILRLETLGGDSKTTCTWPQSNNKILLGFFYIFFIILSLVFRQLNDNTSVNDWILTYDWYNKRIWNIVSSVETQHLERHLFMHYFFNVVTQILMLWKFLELSCSYPCLHESSPSPLKLNSVTSMNHTRGWVIESSPLNHRNQR